ncbi:hypothetical protein OSG_eHP20_00040 [environmental Halophage eHP-20]|nr:hypothetical protein OSG_eHP20_00040 [environmental Halophage eHP-20]
MEILHVFADRGAEDPTLSKFGDVFRLSIDIEPNRWSESIQADATQIPLKDYIQFDLGVFHPPCGFVSPMSDTGSGSREDWPNLIPIARRIGQSYCNHYIIENKPSDHIDETVVLNGHMFNLGIEYARAFECSFPVEQPPRQQQLAETSPFYYSEKPKGWWAAMKQSAMDFPKAHLAKDTIPGIYLEYLIGHYYKAIETGDLPDYSEYNKEMNTKRAKETNADLSQYE